MSLKRVMRCAHRGSWMASRAWISYGTNSSLETKEERRLDQSHLTGSLSHTSCLNPDFNQASTVRLLLIGFSSCVHQHSVVRALAFKACYSAFFTASHTPDPNPIKMDQ